ncbi:DUF6673 family protein [Thalassobacillus sp. C254]|uniref:DUF6673 family protein n=1 Tax=Thalassobacillus sp. C254 TaxID=1225341 RepID=UPI0006D20836|nr:DUF6673 family protein [Thalassobacillus sp. C254]
MARIQIDLDLPYDEFEIAEKEYHVYFDDNSLEKYEKELEILHAEWKKKKDLSKLNAKQKEEYKKEQMKKVARFIEAFFGEGTFEEIYEATGKSMINLVAVVEAVSDWLTKKLGKIKMDQKEYYTK